MTQKNVIIWVIVALVVIVGGWYLFANQSNPASTTDTTSASDTADVQSAHTAGQVTALATKGANFTCSVNATGPASNTTGTIYASNRSVRLDLQVQASGVSVITHTIRNGTVAYNWTDGQSSGTKTTISATAPVVSAPSGGVISDTDSGTIASDCHPWIPDVTQFTPPTNITFVAQ